MDKDHKVSNEIAAFIEDCRERQLSDKTVAAHQKHLYEFLADVDRHSSKSVEAIAPYAVNSFIRIFRGEKSITQIDAYKRSIRTFFSWYSKKTGDYIPYGGHGIGMPVNERPVRNGVPTSTIDRMVKICEDDFIGRRDRAIIRILFDTGIRSIELCNLVISDLHGSLSKVQITSVKKLQCREIEMSSITIHKLRWYLKLRKPCEPTDFLFIDKDRQKLEPKTISGILRRRSLAVSGYKCVLPRDLRVSYGTTLYRKTRDILLVSKNMGYCSIPDPKYFTGIVPDEIMQMYDNRDRSRAMGKHS